MISLQCEGTRVTANSYTLAAPHVGHTNLHHGGGHVTDPVRLSQTG